MRLLSRILTSNFAGLKKSWKISKKKNELFTTLKRVLNEQSKEKPAATTQSTYLQPSVRPNQAGQFHRGGVGGGYVTSASDPYGKHLLQTAPTNKRPRSPSPPPRGRKDGPAQAAAVAAAAAAAWPFPPASTGGGSA